MPRCAPPLAASTAGHGDGSERAPRPTRPVEAARHGRRARGRQPQPRRVPAERVQQVAQPGQAGGVPRYAGGWVGGGGLAQVQGLSRTLRDEEAHGPRIQALSRRAEVQQEGLLVLGDAERVWQGQGLQARKARLPALAGLGLAAQHLRIHRLRGSGEQDEELRGCAEDVQGGGGGGARERLPLQRLPGCLRALWALQPGGGGVPRDGGGRGGARRFHVQHPDERGGRGAGHGRGAGAPGGDGGARGAAPAADLRYPHVCRGQQPRGAPVGARAVRGDEDAGYPGQQLHRQCAPQGVRQGGERRGGRVRDL
mmetsp:Transcript_16730/g.52716  ORF Transcript_16730/g.52716 Transcript_16730/m.52716 type:complete len:311 (-) Transcript_16730:2844-3776(-)